MLRNQRRPMDRRRNHPLFGSFANRTEGSEGPRGVADINTQLLLVVRRGDLEGVENALSRGADVNARDERGYTALMLASMEGRLEVAEMLLERGADGGATSANEYRYTALNLARTPAMTFLLREYGAQR